MLKKNGRAHDRLLSDFDVAFFEQRLRNNAFDGDSMVSLVNTTFSWIHNLQMPLRDSATAAAKDRVMNSGTTLLEVVRYIMECHKCIDTLHADVKDFYENRNHPVVQQMLKEPPVSRSLHVIIIIIIITIKIAILLALLQYFVPCQKINSQVSYTDGRMSFCF